MPVPPPAHDAMSSAAAGGMTSAPRRRKRTLQPHIRYAPTTSQTKRLSAPAQVPHGKPSARKACTTSSPVWASQPSRTPQMASLPRSSGVPSPPAYASAASPYATSAGQTRSSAIVRRPSRASAARQRGELRGLAVEAHELGADDRDPHEHREQHDGVDRRNVFLARAHAAVSASRRSRRLASMRLPSSSMRYMTCASANSAAHETQNAANIVCVICAPWRVKTVGWVKTLASLIARKVRGIKGQPKTDENAARGGAPRPRPGLEHTKKICA